MYAFLSVYSKTGIEDFARELRKLGYHIIASGGTAKHLKAAAVPVTDLAKLIGAGEMLHHKVVTLDRKFHAMLLADESPEETMELNKLGVPRIDLLCCDFYPQVKIGQTDIGGPTMIRAATKGKRIVICDVADRDRVISALNKDKIEGLKKQLWAKAELSVAEYVRESAQKYLPHLPVKYGENRWQKNSSLLITANEDPFSPEKFTLKEGSDRSYINFTDIDRLLQSATHIAAGFKKNFKNIPKLAIGAKHGNLCGAGIGGDALKKMLSGDPQAISGGWVLVNFAIGQKEAKLLKEGRILDGVIAPAITDDAIEILARKSGKCRIVVNKKLRTHLHMLDEHLRFRYIRGGVLTQSNYTFVPVLKNKDLLLAWAVGSTSNSNTVTLVRDGTLIANATGQQSRVLACRLALMIAKNSGHEINGSAAYSDSFFPFLDGPKLLVDNGVKSLFVTSGSIRDKEVFDYLKSSEIKVFSPSDEEARGFYAH
ncbi:MAG: hypothetical protein AAB420_01950 [Patescibacteria group bacterium]